MKPTDRGLLTVLGVLHMGSGTHAEDPASILRRRYAAGEIDQATYERMRRELDV